MLLLRIRPGGGGRRGVRIGFGLDAHLGGFCGERYTLLVWNLTGGLLKKLLGIG